MTRWHGPRGILVEIITLGARQRIKVTQTVNGRRYLLGYYGAIAQIVRHVDLADLVEVVDLHAFASRKSSRKSRA
ncbi:hypothetical protein [Nonomuraea sp. NPDC049684]|uniref:hypothetical protein n=1 Tax=Nonomuraea sp. NPDC049684 TaxID=3364356 RepID=UPI003788FE1F